MGQPEQMAMRISSFATAAVAVVADVDVSGGTLEVLSTRGSAVITKVVSAHVGRDHPCPPGKYEHTHLSIIHPYCKVCGHEGVDYDCLVGNRRTGVPCNGTTKYDTQTCGVCGGCSANHY